MNRLAVLLACAPLTLAAGDCDALRMRMMEAAAKRQHLQLIWVNCPQPKLEARQPNAAASAAVALATPASTAP